jgi:hypothetical protein
MQGVRHGRKEILDSKKERFFEKEGDPQGPGAQEDRSEKGSPQEALAAIQPR